jgi:hypothetical protein
MRAPGQVSRNWSDSFGMTHPIMFEADDPLLGRLRALALRLPEAEERVSHGRPWFHLAGRTAFAVYGSGTRGPDPVMHPHGLVVHVDDDERQARVQDPRFFVPAYLGPKGWLGIDLDDVDWAEVEELLDASWRHAAPKRLLAGRDAR